MWSGTTLHNKSGNLLGAHQKFDRVAAEFVHEIEPAAFFPKPKQILHFEGNNGPDGIKRKSPGKDEPWHYWDPTDPQDLTLMNIIDIHYNSLVKALVVKDQEKAAFEAAWLAHAIVDGLTPAHHYPYEQKLMELRGGEAKETRNSIHKKAIIKGDTRRQTLQKNWQFWGAKGLFVSHFLFEWGVSTLSRPLKLKNAKPTKAEVRHAQNLGLVGYMHESAMTILKLNMYERFIKRGWSPSLTKDIRAHLAPTITRTIAVIWLMAVDDAR
jgi:hypothetical protein